MNERQGKTEKMSIGGKIVFVFGVLQCLFLPGLIFLSKAYGLRSGWGHYALGGIFFMWGIANIRNSRRRPDALPDKDEPSNPVVSLPETVECPGCNESLDLDASERSALSFSCPECGLFSDFSTSTHGPNVPAYAEEPANHSDSETTE